MLSVIDCGRCVVRSGSFRGHIRHTLTWSVIVTLRRGDDPTTMMSVQGVVTENLGDVFRFLSDPEGAVRAERRRPLFRMAKGRDPVLSDKDQER